MSGEGPPSSAPASGRNAAPPITTQPISSSVIRSARPAVDRRRISLVVYHRDGTEVVILAPGVPLVVGRCSPSALRIPDRTLSREHARFSLAGERVIVEDLGSTNGTWVEGQRVQRAELAAGDEVLLGGVVACVHALGPPEEDGELSGEDALRQKLAAEVSRTRRFRQPLAALQGDEPLVAGAAMRPVLAAAARLASARIPVILQGETGSGKEVLARFLHEQGPRRGRSMVCVNCGAIPAQLVESTLFGHERGSFTGAIQQQKGIFEEASGGTVLLDEVGELPAAAQAALLRVLETGRLCRVGSSREIAVDVRVLAATHRDLEAMVEEGRFRADLYFRLGGETLWIPPLRERADEIEALALRFLREANEANGREVQGFRRDALAALRRYRWPGNVRELKHAVERAVVITEATHIRAVDLPPRVQAAEGGAPPGAAGEARSGRKDPRGRPGTGRRDAGVAPEARDGGAAGVNGADGADGLHGEEGGAYRAQMQRYEARLILAALEEARWNQTQAARRLGMPLRTLASKIKSLGLRDREG